MCSGWLNGILFVDKGISIAVWGMFLIWSLFGHGPSSRLGPCRATAHRAVKPCFLFVCILQREVADNCYVCILYCLYVPCGLFTNRSTDEVSVLDYAVAVYPCDGRLAGHPITLGTPAKEVIR